MDTSSQAGVAFPLPEKSWATVAWHYTNQIGARNIVESAELWATSPRSLDDPEEVRHGACVVRQVWNNIRKREDLVARKLVDELLDEDLVQEVRNTTYVLSACASPSNGYLWEHFAGRDGVAIGLDLEYFWASKLSLVEMHKQARSSPQKPVISGWWEVIYSPQEQIKAAERTLTMIASDPWNLRRVHSMSDPWGGTPRFHSRVVLSTLMLLMKAPRFSGEKELRLIFGCTPDQTEESRMTPKGPRFFNPAAAMPFMQMGDPKNGLPVYGVAFGPIAESEDAIGGRNELSPPSERVWRMNDALVPDHPIEVPLNASDKGHSARAAPAPSLLE